MKNECSSGLKSSRSAGKEGAEGRRSKGCNGREKRDCTMGSGEFFDFSNSRGSWTEASSLPNGDRRLSFLPLSYT